MLLRPLVQPRLQTTQLSSHLTQISVKNNSTHAYENNEPVQECHPSLLIWCNDWWPLQNGSPFARSVASIIAIGFSFFGVPDAATATEYPFTNYFGVMFHNSMTVRLSLVTSMSASAPTTTTPTTGLLQLSTMLNSEQNSVGTPEKTTFSTISFAGGETSKPVRMATFPMPAEKKTFPAEKQSNKVDHRKETMRVRISEKALNPMKVQDGRPVIVDQLKVTSSPSLLDLKATQQSRSKQNQSEYNQYKSVPSDKPPPKTTIKGELQAIDLRKIAEENKIDVELLYKVDDRPLGIPSQPAIVKIDRDTFQIVKLSQPPLLKWLPPSLQTLIAPRFQTTRVLKSIPNDQLFLASVIAGSLTEMIRTTLLYPLGTVKARVQARTLRSTNRNRSLLRKLRVTWLTFLYETKRGDWYAGIIPSLLISIPASGVYSGVKEVSRRALSMVIPAPFFPALFHEDVATSSFLVHW